MVDRCSSWTLISRGASGSTLAACRISSPRFQDSLRERHMRPETCSWPALSYGTRLRACASNPDMSTKLQTWIYFGAASSSADNKDPLAVFTTMTQTQLRPRTSPQYGVSTTTSSMRRSGSAMRSSATVPYSHGWKTKSQPAPMRQNPPASTSRNSSLYRSCSQYG